MKNLTPFGYIWLFMITFAIMVNIAALYAQAEIIVIGSIIVIFVLGFIGKYRRRWITRTLQEQVHDILGIE